MLKEKEIIRRLKSEEKIKVEVGDKEGKVMMQIKNEKEKLKNVKVSKEMENEIERKEMIEGKY